MPRAYFIPYQLIGLGIDCIVFYAALFAVLFIRFGQDAALQEFSSRHAIPFSALFVAWVFIFYLLRLYDPELLHNNPKFFRNLTAAIMIAAGVGIAFFYFVPIFDITPKINFVLFFVIATPLLVLWRRFFNQWLASRGLNRELMLIGDAPEFQEIGEFIRAHPQFGYSRVSHVGTVNRDSISPLVRTISSGVSISVALAPHTEIPSDFIRELFQNLGQSFELIDAQELFEDIFHKVPDSSLTPEWLVRNIAHVRDGWYDRVSVIFNIVCALFIAVCFVPLVVVVGIGMKIIEPREPIFIFQKRVGFRGKVFAAIKLRTMKTGERGGHPWTRANDPRVTRLGRILRNTHFDELPQVINILRGQMSFIGPRPDLWEVYEISHANIPYYEVRALVKPGILGWAQLYYRYAATVQETRERFLYDLYYLKHRSFLLDMIILSKTFRVFFNPAR